MLDVNNIVFKAVGLISLDVQIAMTNGIKQLPSVSFIMSSSACG